MSAREVIAKFLADEFGIMDAHSYTDDLLADLEVRGFVIKHCSEVGKQLAEVERLRAVLDEIAESRPDGSGPDLHAYDMWHMANVALGRQP